MQTSYQNLKWQARLGWYLLGHNFQVNTSYNSLPERGSTSELM